MNVINFLKSNALILIIFLASIAFSYSYIDFSSNMSVGTGHAFFAKSIVLTPNFDINDYWQNAGEDRVLYKGNYYMPYAPLNAIIMAIPYFGLMCAYFLYTNAFGPLDGNLSVLLESLALSLPSSLALLGILLFLKNYVAKNLNLTKTQASIFLASIALGTILFIYSLSFFNHLISAFFIFAAYYSLTNNLKKKYLIAGTFVALAFLTEFPTILFCLALVPAELFRLYRKETNIKELFKNFLAFSTPILIAILLILCYNYINFDSPFNFGEKMFVEYRLANNKEANGFNQNLLLGLYGSLFSPLKGLFIYSPFLIFALLGLKSLFKTSAYKALLPISYLIIMTCVYSMWDDCFGASVYGNRYLISTIPFWGILLAHSFKTIYKLAIIKYAFFACVAVAITLSTINSLFGIAQGKMEECELYLNTYNPYMKIVENFDPKDKPFKVSPAIFLYIQNINLED